MNWNNWKTIWDLGGTKHSLLTAPKIQKQFAHTRNCSFPKLRSQV